MHLLRTTYCKRTQSSPILCEPCVKKEKKGYRRMTAFSFQQYEIKNPKIAGACTKCRKLPHWTKESEGNKEKIQKLFKDVGLQPSYVERIDVMEKVRVFENKKRRQHKKEEAVPLELEGEIKEEIKDLQVQEPSTSTESGDLEWTEEFPSWRDFEEPTFGKPTPEFVGTKTEQQSPIKMPYEVIEDCLAEINNGIYEDQSLNREEIRKGTFRSWKCPFFSGDQMAAEGFYYTGVLDIVRCFECNLELGQWGRDDSIRQTHERWGNNCRFLEVKRNTSGSEIDPLDIGREVCDQQEMIL